jgi:tRNA-2-methylthio-N6-dimethylallyladenosine synthase
VQRILVEGASRNSATGKAGSSATELMGRTECKRIVNFEGGPQGARLYGQMLSVRITQALPHSLRGEVLVS